MTRNCRFFLCIAALVAFVGQATPLPGDEEGTGVADVGHFGVRPNSDAPIDDAVARAIASGAPVIYFPPGIYRLRRPLNLTERPSGTITIRGAGTGDRPGIATTLVGETGGAIVDATGSQFVTIEDLTLSSGKNNPSTIGILFARSSRNNYAQFDRVINVSIFLENSGRANHDPCTGIGLFNFGAELFRTENLYIRAPLPMVLTNDNFCKVQSAYASVLGSETSLSVVELGSTTLWAFDGPGLVLQNAINVHAGSMYINSQKSNPSKFAIEARGNNTSVSMNVSVENFPSILRYSGILDNLNLNVTTPDASKGPSLVADGTTHSCAVLRSSQIRVSSLIALQQPGPHYLLDYQGKNVCGVQESLLFLAESQGINMPLGYFSGTVYSASPNPSIRVADSPGFVHYVLIPRSGAMKITGEMSSAQPSPGITASQAAASSAGNSCAVSSGSGDPNQRISGKPCDMYLNKSGGPGKTLYIKESGENTNTGWAAK